METHIVVPLKQCLANMPVDGHWLQCVVCGRFFHIDSVVADRTRTPRCPFADCRGHGDDCDGMFGNTQRQAQDPRWPNSATDELYDQRARRRHAELIDAFEQSDERATLAADGPVRFLSPFLWMQHCCSWDPDDDFFADDLARASVGDVFRWAAADDIQDHAAIVSELLAFWAFAERTALLPAAPQWHTLLRAMVAGH